MQRRGQSGRADASGQEYDGLARHVGGSKRRVVRDRNGGVWQVKESEKEAESYTLDQKYDMVR